MDNWLNPLFIISLSTGIIFIVTAIITSRYPPKKINYIYGYRTKNSMKSNERWDFAQKYSNDQMRKLGIAFIIIGLSGYFTSFSVITGTIVSITLIIILTLFLFYKTEQAIKKKFGDK